MKFLKPLLRQSLGEAISQLIIGGYKPNIKEVLQCLIMDKMTVHFDVFHPSMKEWIRCQVFGPHIVTLKASAPGRQNLNLTKKCLYPHKLSSCISYGFVFNFCARP
jgi:hypothetical protein